MTANAASLGLYVCPACDLVSRPPPLAAAADCPRCGTHLHRRKPHSLERTAAYLAAAWILYLPANLLPIMQTDSLFGSHRDTIMSGVVSLWSSGSWVLALIVFVASIMVPLLKLIALSLLLVTALRRSTWRAHDRVRLYRLIGFVGRWSMLDIYVLTILVALVRIPSLAIVNAGPGALAFGAVVVLNILALMSFDPRLIWDPSADGSACR